VTAAEVVAPQPKERQACEQCRCLSLCWAPQLSEAATVINFLVCRITRHIEREAATRLLLEMLESKLQRVAALLLSVHGARRAGWTHSDLVAELQSVVIESLLTTYHVGEQIHPLRWLFAYPKGAVSCWAVKQARLNRRDFGVLWSYDSTAPSGGDIDDARTDFEERVRQLNYRASGTAVRSGNFDAWAVPGVEYDATAEAKGRYADAIALVDDGMTFPISEYRVLRFCLTSSNAAIKVPLSGVHAFLAQMTHTPRKAVSRVYGLAKRRLLDATGRTEAFLRRKNITIPPSATRRRAHRLCFKATSESLTAAEICTLMGLRKRGITNMDLAWIFGISEDFVYKLRRRFEQLPPEEIHARCRT